MPSSMSTPRTCSRGPSRRRSSHDGQANGVGTSRGSRREHAMWPVIGRRCAEQFEPLRAIKHPDNEQVGKTLDIGGARPRLRQYFEHPVRFMFSSESFGNLLGVFVATPTHPMGCNMNMVEFFIFSCDARGYGRPVVLIQTEAGLASVRHCSSDLHW